MDTLGSVIDFLNTNFFEMAFGLIISIVLFLIDRGGKNRQEEALRRQDESLDIILEQVSKVNIFQTRTLSLAIESISTELGNFKHDISIIKESLALKSTTSTQEAESEFSQIPIETSEDLSPVSEQSVASTFGDILSKQVSTFIDQIKSNLSDLAKKEKENHQKNLYKVKKSLEFDMKDLFNIQSMLESMKSDNESEESRKEKTDVKKGDKEKLEMKDEVKSSNISNEQIDQSDTNSIPENNSQLNIPSSKDIEERIMEELNMQDFDKQLERLESIPEIIKLTENFIKNFDSTHNLKTDSQDKKIKRKVKPSKIISKDDFDASDK